jgi:hypothetical protein
MRVRSNLGPERFWKSTWWFANVTLHVLHDRLRERQFFGAFENRLSRQSILNHELCKIADYLRRWRDLHEQKQTEYSFIHSFAKVNEQQQYNTNINVAGCRL